MMNTTEVDGMTDNLLDVILVATIYGWHIGIYEPPSSKGSSGMMVVRLFNRESNKSHAMAFDKVLLFRNPEAEKLLINEIILRADLGSIMFDD